MPVADWRGYLWKLRWDAARAITPRRQVACRGVRFTLQCENWPTLYRWQTYATKEAETLDWLDRELRADDALFDIGANIGVYTLYAARRQPRARIVAFEAEYANLHLLRDNVIANGLQAQVEVYAAALSDRAGITRLHIQDFAPGAALHTEAPGRLAQTLAGRAVRWHEGICALTLDAFCEESGIWPQCLKLDVDGTEDKILSGAAGALRQPGLRSVLLEMPAAPEAAARCAALLGAAGLQLAWQDPAGRSANQIWRRGGDGA